MALSYGILTEPAKRQEEKEHLMKEPETVTRFKCCHCKKVISPDRGKLVQGNIYMIGDTIHDRGGLIGSGLQSRMLTKLADITVQAFCDFCFKKALYVGSMVESEIEEPEIEDF